MALADRSTKILAIGVLACVPLADRSMALDGKHSELPFVYETWQTFTTQDGLPHDRIWAIRVFGEKVWVGTDGGLALFEGAEWKSWTPKDGLHWPIVSAIDLDARTGDLWLGTWGGGLSRFTGGRFDRFDQLNSGLAGNFVFSVAVVGGRVWAATNGGVSVFDPAGDTWELYLGRRADTAETAITNLFVDPTDNEYLYAAGWCEGLRRFDTGCGEWSFVDGDALRRKPGELTVVSVPGSAGAGVQTMLSAATVGRTLWLATQENLLRGSAGERWETCRMVSPAQVGLPGDLVRCLATRSDREAWLGAWHGLRALADWRTGTWVAYRRCAGGTEGQAVVTRDGQVLQTLPCGSTIPDNRIRCVAFQNQDVWVGTVKGLARGVGKGRWDGLRPVPQTVARPEQNPGAGSGLCGQGSQRNVPVGKVAEAWPGDVTAVTITAAGTTTRPISLPGEHTPASGRKGSVDLPAVTMAIDQVNARGGYRELVPFRLAAISDAYTFTRYGWSMAEDEIVYCLRHLGIQGVVHYIPPGRRISTALAHWMEVPYVNAATSPATVDETISGWVYRPRSDDQESSRLILDYLFYHRRISRVAVLRTPSGTDHQHLDRWSEHVRARGYALAADVVGDPYADDFGKQLLAIRNAGAQAILTWCPARTSAQIVRRMRRAGMGQVFVGGDQVVDYEFVRFAGPDPGPVLAAYSCTARVPKISADRLGEMYRARFKKRPTPDALASFRATLLLLEGINIAGLDHERIRTTLRDISNAVMADLQDGRWKFHTSADLLRLRVIHRLQRPLLGGR